jgi:nitrogen fixation protein NifU and related proteins
MDDLYQQQILDLYKNPTNFGKMRDADYIVTETNASCGDSYTFYIRLKKPSHSGVALAAPSEDESSKQIETISFTGTGCAISTAACALLAQSLEGKPVSKVVDIDLDYMQQLIGSQVSTSRQKCLMLPVVALAKIKTR